MPALIALGVQALWALIRYLLPWVLGGTAVAIGVRTGKMQEFFWWALAQFVVMAENFLSFVRDETGMIQVLDLNDLPQGSLIYLSHMRVPEALTIVLSGMAIRIVRKMILRF